MAVSPVFEFLASLRRPGSHGQLLALERMQAIVPSAPPGFRLALITTPSPNVGWICSTTTIGPLVPNAWTLDYFQAGVNPYSAVITADIIRWGFDYFLLSTNALPITIELTNNSNMNQRWEHSTMHLVVATEEDLDMTIWAMKRFGQPASIIELFQDMARSLRGMPSLPGVNLTTPASQIKVP